MTRPYELTRHLKHQELLTSHKTEAVVIRIFTDLHMQVRSASRILNIQFNKLQCCMEIDEKVIQELGTAVKQFVWVSLKGHSKSHQSFHLSFGDTTDYSCCATYRTGNLQVFIHKQLTHDRGNFKAVQINREVFLSSPRQTQISVIMAYYSQSFEVFVLYLECLSFIHLPDIKTIPGKFRQI